MLASCKIFIAVAVLCFSISLSEAKTWYDWTHDSRHQKNPYDIETIGAKPADELMEWKEFSRNKRTPCIGDIVQHFFGDNKIPTSALTQSQQSALLPAAVSTRTEAPKAAVTNPPTVEDLPA